MNNLKKFIGHTTKQTCLCVCPGSCPGILGTLVFLAFWGLALASTSASISGPAWPASSSTFYVIPALAAAQGHQSLPGLLPRLNL